LKLEKKNDLFSGSLSFDEYLENLLLCIKNIFCF